MSGVHDDLAIVRGYFGSQTAGAAALRRVEAEIARLREERDDWKGKAEFAGIPAWTKLWNEKQAAEAELRDANAAIDDLIAEKARLRDGLRMIPEKWQRVVLAEDGAA